MAIAQILSSLGSIFLLGRQLDRAGDLEAAATAQEDLEEALNEFQAKVGDWETCSREIKEAQQMAETMRAGIMSLTADTVQPACEVLLETRDLKVNSVGTGNTQHALNKAGMNALIGFLNDHEENCAV